MKKFGPKTVLGTSRLMVPHPSLGYDRSPEKPGAAHRREVAAHYETCIECGYAGGRHSRLCPRVK